MVEHVSQSSNKGTGSYACNSERQFVLVYHTAAYSLFENETKINPCPFSAQKAMKKQKHTNTAFLYEADGTVGRRVGWAVAEGERWNILYS